MGSESGPLAALDQVDRTANKFFSVARARVVGIFTDFNLVQAYVHFSPPPFPPIVCVPLLQIKDYPNPLYKKFDTFAEAETYFLRLSAGQFPDADGCELLPFSLPFHSFSHLQQRRRNRKRGMPFSGVT